MKIVIKKSMQKPFKHFQDHIEQRGNKIWKTMQKSDIENGMATRAIGLYSNIKLSDDYHMIV